MYFTMRVIYVMQAPKEWDNERKKSSSASTEVTTVEADRDAMLGISSSWMKTMSDTG